MLPPPSVLGRLLPPPVSVPPRKVFCRGSPQSLRAYSQAMMRILVRQLDYVATQRFRRTCTLLGHYSRVWERERLRQILKQMGRQLFGKQGRYVGSTSLVHFSALDSRYLENFCHVIDTIQYSSYIPPSA